MTFLRINLVFVLLISFSITTPIFAQESPEEAAEIKKIMFLLKAFNEDASKLVTMGSLQANELLSYANNDLFYQSTTVNILNQVNRRSADKKMVAHVLKEMRQSNVTAKRVIGSFTNFTIRDNIAVTTYDLEYELYESDRIINKGHQVADVILRKDANGDWKIESLMILNVDDKTYKSTCICEIYETKGLQNIITETILPDGHDADVVEDKFSIDESTDPRTIRHGFRDYLWSANGAIFKRNLDGSQGDQIGNAPSRQELLLTLIKKEVYPDRCESVVRKLK